MSKYNSIICSFYKHMLKIFALILLVFAILKITEFTYSFNSPKQDPLFTWMYSSHIKLFAGFIEICVAGILVSLLKLKVKYVVLMWLSFVFALYRSGLYLVAASGNCGCASELVFSDFNKILSSMSTYTLVAMFIISLSFLLLNNKKTI